MKHCPFCGKIENLNFIELEEEKYQFLLEALKDTLDFVERHSNRWDPMYGKHPYTIVENARKALGVELTNEETI